MDHFGLSSVKDLPKLKDLQSIDANEIGMPSDLNDESNEVTPADFEEPVIENDEVTEVITDEFEETIIEFDDSDRVGIEA